MDLKEEKALIARCRKEPQAFGLVFDRHFDGIFRFALHRLADVAAAEDVAAQTFYQALRNLHRFRWSGVPISAWLYRIAVNEANTLDRKGRGWRPIEATLGAESIEAPGRPPDLELLAAEESLRREKDFLMLHQAIGELKPADRSLIVLRHLEKKSYGEIAAILKTREGALRMRNQRALEKLKHILQSRGLDHVPHGRDAEPGSGRPGGRVPAKAAAEPY